MAARYPDIRTDQYHIDILTAFFVSRPDHFDVVVGSNLFGDILSDLGPAVCGTIGIAPCREHQSRAQISVDLRARARIGAGYRRQGHRQSDRADLVGGADARSSRSRRTPPRRWCVRSRRCSPTGARRAHPTSAARRRHRRWARPSPTPSGSVMHHEFVHLNRHSDPCVEDRLQRGCTGCEQIVDPARARSTGLAGMTTGAWQLWQDSGRGTTRSGARGVSP